MNSFYNDTLYPLQDKVLQVVQQLNTPFYLTGGTALSRFYFHHRYSDDLDFFINQDNNFSQYLDQIIPELNKVFKVEIKLKSATYYSLTINDILKVDFVNDIAFRYGDNQSFPIFDQVDNVENILSNKLSALIGRDEPKDVVDIWIIAKNKKIDWPRIFQDTSSKAAGIFPPDITQKLTAFPTSLLDRIKWIDTSTNPETFSADINTICDSILSPL